MSHDYDLQKLKTAAEKIVQTGRDGNALTFDCESFDGRKGNDGKVLKYEIRLDMDARETTCSCPDAACRKKVWHHVVPSSRGCKHVEVFRVVVVPILRKAGLI